MNGVCSGTHISNQVPKLFCVPPTDAKQYLSLAEPFLKSALDRTGIGDYGDLRNAILVGGHLLWLVIDRHNEILAAVSTQLQRTAKGKICVISACGGKSIRKWLHLTAEIETYAADEGCEVVRYFGRRGWLRKLPDYEQIGVIADKPLTIKTKLAEKS